MQVIILPALILLSTSSLFSTVCCAPNHHHNNHNEHFTSESTVEILKSEKTDGNEIPVVAQNGTTIEVTSGGNRGLGTGYIVGIPIVSILFFICFWYCICKCCCECCQKERPGVVVMQSNTMQAQQPAPAPQIILQQPIIHQQAPPVYDASQRWAQPPPQWNQPPQGPQWAPHPMGQQQQYSPNSGYDNAGFNPATAPPPYNTGKY
ncbi:uncharacterized protein LOC129971560 isoform X2 [Argiope bruennichi]|uniref:uncharacterized protein LOC129971560 isoform X2 n=1 Tax=Argiope bruennichi TaxID=94029 RepID=UPI002494691E|nr:uncharacterized protein LOC129971560 isoform X2 [Argiope bruennichi]